jgi:putative acetyltransferase
MEIEIRHAEPKDYEAIHTMMAQPRAYTGTLQMPYPSIETWRKRLENPPDGMVNLVACIEGNVVGQLGLHAIDRPRRRHVGSIGMAVHDDWQGKGVGTALMAAAVDLADNWFNLLRLELQVYVDNEPALHLYQKFGFEIEGTLRCYAYREGKYVDSYTMARLRPGCK